MLVTVPVPNLHHEDEIPEVLMFGRKGSRRYYVSPRVAWAFLGAEVTRLPDLRKWKGATEQDIRHELVKVRERFLDDQVSSRGPLAGGTAAIILGMLNDRGQLARYYVTGMPTADPQDLVALLVT
jgi:hypothetical protein